MQHGSLRTCVLKSRANLNKHFILWNGATIAAAAAVFSGTTAEQEFQADGYALHDSRELTDRGYHGLVDHVGRLLDAVESAAKEFIGTNDLKAGAIDGVVDRRIHALHLRSQDDGRGLQIVGDDLEFGADFCQEGFRVIDCG